MTSILYWIKSTVQRLKKQNILQKNILISTFLIIYTMNHMYNSSRYENLVCK